MISLYDGAKTRVRVDFELSEEIEVKVGMHHGSFLFAVAVDVVTKFAGEFALSELLYADDVFLMRESKDSGISSYNGRRLLRARV